jgi:hypothetical protein
MSQGREKSGGDVQCSQGHDNEVGKRFCGECGEALAPIASEQATERATPNARSKRFLIGGIAAGIVVIGIVAIVAKANSSKHTLDVHVACSDCLIGQTPIHVGESCTGHGNATSGSTVTVTNESGRVIGLGTLSDGSAGKDTGIDSSGFDHADCLFSATIKTGSAHFYNVAVGNDSGVKYSNADLRDASWRVDLSQ